MACAGWCDTSAAETPVRCSALRCLHKPDLFISFVLCTILRWEVNCILSCVLWGMQENRIAFMSSGLSDRHAVWHVPFQNMPVASDPSLLHPPLCVNWGFIPWFSSTCEDIILKWYCFAFNHHTMSCGHKDKLFEWFCIYSRETRGKYQHPVVTFISEQSTSSSFFYSWNTNFHICIIAAVPPGNVCKEIFLLTV